VLLVVVALVEPPPFVWLVVVVLLAVSLPAAAPAAAPLTAPATIAEALQRRPPEP
jgi:hypothetical protein